jgi:hypothetical protein
LDGADDEDEEVMGARVDAAVVEGAVTTPEEADGIAGGTVDVMGNRWIKTNKSAAVRETD